jgi:hypothetical protein
MNEQEEIACFIECVKALVLSEWNHLKRAEEVLDKIKVEAQKLVQQNIETKYKIGLECCKISMIYLKHYLERDYKNSFKYLLTESNNEIASIVSNNLFGTDVQNVNKGKAAFYKRMTLIKKIVCYFVYKLIIFYYV